MAADGEATSHRVLTALNADPDSASQDANMDDTAQSAGDSDDERTGEGNAHKDASRHGAEEKLGKGEYRALK
jgi:hypothetical protein